MRRRIQIIMLLLLTNYSHVYCQEVITTKNSLKIPILSFLDNAKIQYERTLNQNPTFYFTSSLLKDTSINQNQREKNRYFYQIGYVGPLVSSDSINPKYSEVKIGICHSFLTKYSKIFLNITGVIYDQDLYIGQEFGLYFNSKIIPHEYQIRLYPTFVNYGRKDLRVGADFGFSAFRTLYYIGYYYPIGKNEIKEIPPYRFGVSYHFYRKNSNDKRNKHIFKNAFENIGFQIGYNGRKSKYSGIEIGINKHNILKDGISGIGPFANIVGLFYDNNLNIGQQIGFDYHNSIANSIFQVRICPTFENLSKKDMRVGIDFGFSSLGGFFYVGYHSPVGKNELKDIPRFRFGVRLIINTAGMENLSLY